MSFEEIRVDCAVRQKKGLHFIIASVMIWTAVSVIHFSSFTIEQKNFFTFCCSAAAHGTGFHYIQNYKSGFFRQGKPADPARHFIFRQSDTLYSDCDVGVRRCSGENADGLHNDFRSAFDAVRMALSVKIVLYFLGAYPDCGINHGIVFPAGGFKRNDGNY